MKPASLICGRCRSTYDSSAWTDLEILDVLDSDCVRRGLADWPPGLSIEVRRCARCGEEIARPVSAARVVSS